MENNGGAAWRKNPSGQRKSNQNRLLPQMQASLGNGTQGGEPGISPRPSHMDSLRTWCWLELLCAGPINVFFFSPPWATLLSPACPIPHAGSWRRRFTLSPQAGRFRPAALQQCPHAAPEGHTQPCTHCRVIKNTRDFF